jgi:hypothetical protein
LPGRPIFVAAFGEAKGLNSPLTEVIGFEGTRSSRF